MKRDRIDPRNHDNMTPSATKKRVVDATPLSKIIVTTIQEAIRCVWDPIDSDEDSSITQIIQSSVSIWKNYHPFQPRHVGKEFYDIEIRSPTSLYHRFKRANDINDLVSVIDSIPENKVQKPKILQIRSPYGVYRQFTSPLEFSAAVLPIIEEAFMQKQISQHIRIHPTSGFITVATHTFCETLRSKGLEPCPYCPQWCRGRKGLWWHIQQLHNVNHAVASTAATSMCVEQNSAIIVYREPQPTTTSSLTLDDSIPNDDENDSKTADVITKKLQLCEARIDDVGMTDRLFVLVKQLNLQELKSFIKKIDQKGELELDTFLQNAVDNNGASLLLWSAGVGSTSMVQYFVEQHSLDPNFKQRGKRSFRGRTALHWAARNGHVETVKYLLSIPSRKEKCQQKCKIIDKKGSQSPDCNVEFFGNHDQSKNRLVDIDATTVDGTTAFCWAAWQGHIAVMKVLQDSGCDVQTMNSFGCNPVLWAAQGQLTASTSIPQSKISRPNANMNYSDVRCIEYLENVGCDIYVVNKSGHGLLHKAAQRGCFHLCEWFTNERLVPYLLSITKCDIVSCKNILQLIGPDNEQCSPSDLAGMENNTALALTLAKYEEMLIQLVSRLFKHLALSHSDLPLWLQQDTLPANNRHDHLRFEPMAGVHRMRQAINCSLHRK